MVKLQDSNFQQNVYMCKGKTILFQRLSIFNLPSNKIQNNRTCSKLRQFDNWRRDKLKLNCFCFAYEWLAIKTSIVETFAQCRVLPKSLNRQELMGVKRHSCIACIIVKRVKNRINLLILTINI